MRRRYLMSAMLAAGLLTTNHALPAQQSGGSNSNPPPSDSNAFPEDTSKKAASQKKDDQQTQKPDAGTAPATDGASDQDNAFPEETSRKAADAAKVAEGPTNSSPGSGSSSSGSSSSSAEGGSDPIQHNVNMPHGLLKKETLKENIQVGTFYLQSGDFVGAYARFKAAAALHPESTDAMFGLAEAARHLKKTDEAEQNYSLFLEIVPTGSKAKDARKALASLEKAQR